MQTDNGKDLSTTICNELAVHGIKIKSILPVHESSSYEPAYRVNSSEGCFFVKISLKNRFTPNVLSAVRKINGDEQYILPPVLSFNSQSLERQVNVYDWLSGNDLRNVMQNCPIEMCNRYGAMSGKLMRMIHEKSFTDVREAFNLNQKLEDYLMQINEHRFKFAMPFDYVFYMDENLALLNRDTELHFIHMDFKPKNIMSTESDRLIAVDIDSCAFGDPWLDFYDKAFPMYRAKEIYCSSLIHSYFGGNIPSRFWEYFKVLSVFALMQNTAWLLRRNDLAYVRELEKYIWNAYDGFTLDVPAWYRKSQTALL